MKLAIFEYMLFASLRSLLQQKQDAAHKALNGFNSYRKHGSLVFKRHGIERTAIKMLLTLWICSVVISFSIVRGEEDLEIRLDGENPLGVNITDLKAKETDTELILLFKTMQSSGVILWATGKTGDMMLVELVRGKVRIILGTSKNSSKYEEIILEDDLCDNKWHQLNLKIMQDTTYAKVDVGTPFSAKTKRKLALDEKLMIGGVTKQNTIRTISKRNFHGCVSYIMLNELNVLHKLSKQDTGLHWGCEGDTDFDAISFDAREAFMSFLNPEAPKLDIGLQFRTYYQDGVLITNEVNNRSNVNHDSKNIMGFTLYFEKNVVNLRVHGRIVASIRPSEDIDFGSWHAVSLRMSSDFAILTLGEQSKTVKIKSRLPRTPYEDEVFVGKGSHVAKTFQGWIWNITMKEKRLSYVNATRKNAIIINYYKMKDYCYPNRCDNGGRCIQTYDGWRCNCSSTGFDGATCSKRIKTYKKTCYDYYVSGEQASGFYVIEPQSKPIKVYCKMDDKDGPKTIVRSKQGSQLKAVYEGLSSDKNFYYHRFDYFVEKDRIDDLIKTSGYCRQYIEFYCSSSTLMFSNDEENALANRYGARWFSNDGRIQHYWGGSNKKAFTCACGLKGNCADPSLKCNCDIMDNKWRSDGGFLDDKEDLPVSRLQFSRKYTNPSSMYKLGPLECFQNRIKTTLATVQTTTLTPKVASSLVRSISTKVNRRPEWSSSASLSSATPMKTETTTRKVKHSTESVQSTALPRTTDSPGHSSTSKEGSVSESPRSKVSAENNISTSVIGQKGELLSAGLTTKTVAILRSTSAILLSNRHASHSSQAINGKQMIILVALIASLALLTLLLIAAVLRQRIFKTNKKLTVELAKDPENGSTYSETGSISAGPFVGDDKQYMSTSDINRIEIIRVANPYSKSIASESVSSVSSFDTSRYLEVGGEESDTASFTKRKGILKSKNKFIMSSRPKSEGDIDDPEEAIGLIHINSVNPTSKSAEDTLLLSKKNESLDEVKFHLHPRDAYRRDKLTNYSLRDSYSDKESIDAETGFITDSSSSCDSSRKSLSSSGSEESNDEFYSKKLRRPKRSVTFSIQELSPKKEANSIRKSCHGRLHNDVADEVFT